MKSTSKLVGRALLGAALGLGPLVAAEKTPALTRPQLMGKQGDAKFFVAVALAKDLVSPEQSPAEQAQADAAWKHVFDPVDERSIEFVDEKGRPSNVMLGDTLRRQTPTWQRDLKEITWTEHARRALRERGQKFWEDYPKDVRRYVWLFATTGPGNVPFYWDAGGECAQLWQDWLNDHSSRGYSTAPIDRPAKALWETNYLVMRAEFLTSTQVENGAKAVLRRNELSNRAFHDLQRNKLPDSMTEAEVALRWTRFLTDFFDFAERNPDILDGLPTNIDWPLEKEAKYYPQLYPKLRAQFLAAAKLSSSDGLKDFAINASAEPVEVVVGQPVPGLKFATLKNQAVDRKVWHGKVVLLDFWAFWCHSCIEAMPHLKKLYEKYHEQGLEIYGVCFAEKGETPQKIVDLMKQMQIPWEQAMREPLRNDRFGRIYSFTSLPQLLLLDKNGNLAAQNVYEIPALEDKINELLAQKIP